MDRARSTARTSISRTAPAALALASALLLASTFPAGCAAPPPPVSAPEPPPAPPPEPSITATAAPEPPKPKPHRFAVAAESATAARIAMDVLERGGSAADAAIAGVFASGVTHPVSSGIGGGGFAVVWDAKEKAIHVLDFRETAPIGIKPNDYFKRDRLPDNKRGVMVGVPGEVAGLAEIHHRWGKLAFAEDVRPAAEAAEKGFPVSAHLARALKWSESWIKRTPRYAFLAPGGAVIGPKETVKNTALAATLRRIGAEGKAAFYEGAIAADVVETARSAGSRINAQELREYKVLERAPVHTKWEGYDVFTMPPPSAGGLTVLETLHMHKKADLAALGYGSGAYLHLLAETFRGAVGDRMVWIGDPAFNRADLAALAGPQRMAARRARISLTETRIAERFVLDEAGTSHFVAVDDQGNVVSLTSTVNNMFGSRLVTKGGFVLNDQLDDFTSMALEKRFGIRPGRGPNSPRGGARPASSMTPTLVLKDGEPIFAAGGSGGLRIATATTQVLLARLVFDRNAADAVADPRIDTPPTGGLFIDPSAPPAVLGDLAQRGEVVESTKPNFSAVQAVSIGVKDGVRWMSAGADPRKGGAALVE
ncbi:Gamma-glutamyltranspeptidase [Minicystis rosea]|nr:Gamma-glutamyltranspeptidase [Minicystis rosea]